MSVDKPWNDVADQLCPACPDLEPGEVPDAVVEAVLEANPADVADQLCVVPLPEDPYWS